MNILVVAHYHYQGVSVPTALFVHEQMRAYLREGHRVRIIVPIAYGKRGENGLRFGPAVWKDTVDGIEHVYMRHVSFSSYGNKGLNTKSAKLSMRMLMGRLLEDFMPDVIHAHKLGTNTELAAMIRDAVGCPLVFTTHGETNCEEPWMGDQSLIAPFANKADVMICVSSLLQKNMQEAGVDVPVRVILNGFNADHIVPGEEKIQHSLNQTGYLEKTKRIDVSLNAFAKIKEKYPDAVFTIVGKGREEDSLKALAHELQLEDSVSFLGQLPNQQAISQMQKAQFFVMPSYPEGFGIVYLEAMASGCITIGTEGQGIADLIKHGKNGFLVPPGDSDAIAAIIEQCNEHPEWANIIAEQGIEDARNLTWDNNAKQYFSLFSVLVEGGELE